MEDGREQLPIQLGTGGGALGTGIHLVWTLADTAPRRVAEVWATLLFLPVVPLGTWVLERQAAPEGRWVVRAIRPPTAPRSVLTAATFCGGALLALVPAYVALELFMGRQLIGITGLLMSAGLIVGAWAWLDSTRARIPLRAAFNAYSTREALVDAETGSREPS
jgi:hypothetical protein